MKCKLEQNDNGENKIREIAIICWIKTHLFLIPYFILGNCLFKFLDYFWAKESNILIFSGQNGQRFDDNSKYLFLKFLENYSEVFRIVWITNNKLLIDDIAENYQIPRTKVKYQFSLSALLTLLRAKYVFYLHGPGDIPYLRFSKKTIAIQLWHGVPIKRIHALDKRNRKHALKIKKSNKSIYNYWISSSSVDRNSTALCVGLPVDRVVATGYPRNDYLIEQMRVPSKNISDRFPFLRKKVILYAPTWRDKCKPLFFPFEDFSLIDLNNFLEENDAYMLLRGHWCDEIYHRNGIIEFCPLIGGRILSANHDLFQDVQELLPFVDILISDYSGIWVDYLLLDRPIIYVPYDLNSYEKERGLLYNYQLITPGPKVSTSKDFLNSLQEYLLDPKKDSDKRICVKKIFHDYEDGLSYQRIHDLVIADIQKNR